MTKDELIQMATETANIMSKLVADAYLNSVKMNVESYDDEYTPNEDDFFAWVEGWERVEYYSTNQSFMSCEPCGTIPTNKSDSQLATDRRPTCK